MVDLQRLPFGGSQPRTREDFRRALLRLCAPFADAEGFARRLDATSHPAAHYAPRVARLELMSRLLWGLAPLAAGGGTYAGWPQIRAEIARGTDPEDPGYWGPATDLDQRIVESAALGFALALAAHEVWEPLTQRQRANFAAWLRTAASAKAADNNWRLFATLVNLGLAAVGEPYDPEIGAASFERIDQFHRGDGWYSDGPEGTPFDYYGPWGIHFYCLINAARGALDARTETWVRERAAAFAGEFAHWFAPDGAAIAYGRSLTYRFAQCSFFGALAFAAPEGAAGARPCAALSWGELRGLWARNLRWWDRQPVLDGAGTLSIGYAYPCLPMSETYNAPGSPYWAFKAFLPLALPADHPFWTADEEPLPIRERIHPQPVASFLLQRDEQGQVIALCAGPGGRWARHGEAKYAKFAYSTAFGFSVASRALTLEGAAGDSMLLLSDDDGRRWRGREENDEVRPMPTQGADAAHVLATWSPWADVHIETLLLPIGEDGRWHARVHWIRTERRLWTAEGGFCVPLDDAVADTPHEAGADGAFAAARSLCSGIKDLTGDRNGRIVVPDPNTHLLWPRTLLPTLRGTLEPGTHRLVGLIYADTAGDGAAGGDAASPGAAGGSTASPGAAGGAAVGAAGFADVPALPDLEVFGVPGAF
ncbi:MAG TPA: DUF2264 domain-containing protein [Actinospica sp.]|nr:DUF2264 domain-containing protein [Actinospica sp.]